MTDRNDNGIDIKAYASVRIRAEDAKPLTRELTHVVPGDADASETRALERLVRDADEIEGVLNEREAVSVEQILGLRRVLITDLGGIHAILSGIGRVHASERAAAARGLRALLFPDNLAFVKAGSTTLWAIVDRRLRNIEAKGQRQLLEQIAGPDVVTSVEASNEALGDALGVGGTKREIPDSTALAKKALRFSRAVGAYCRLLSAKIDEDDPASIERFTKAVAPVDLYRVRRASEEVIDEPVDDPEVPATDPTTEPPPAPVVG